MEEVILITGASGGMGGEMARFFEKKGAKLALHSKQNQIVIAESERVAHFHIDLNTQANCDELIRQVVERFGRIDVLINNAGISRSSMSWKTSEDSWRETMAINVDAPFFLSQSVIPHMRKNEKGRIVNITSIVAQTGFVGTSSYAASKAGLIGLTKTLAKELAGFNITVNSLALGYFNVGMIDDVPEEIQEEIISTIPIGRLGTPITVCSAIEWLLSEGGGYVTGQTINLNGGLFS